VYVVCIYTYYIVRYRIFLLLLLLLLLFLLPAPTTSTDSIESHADVYGTARTGLADDHIALDAHRRYNIII